MTLSKFLELAEENEELRKALDAEKPEGPKALTEFAKKHGFEITPEELDEASLKAATGGVVPNYEKYRNSHGERYIHNTCGGEITNVGALFRSCRCKGCGEIHFFIWSFDYTRIS